MTTFIQLAERWGDVDPVAEFRGGFAAFVRQHADSTADRVVLVEPNPWLAEQLRDQWAWFPRAEVRELDLEATSEPPEPDQYPMRNFWFAAEDTPDFRTFAWDQAAVLRRFPRGTIDRHQVPSRNLADFLGQELGAGSDHVVTIDARRTKLDDLEAIDWRSLGVSRIVLTVQGITPARERPYRRALARSGFRAAGRPWGPAGSTVLMARPTSLAARVTALKLQGWVQAGAAMVQVRDSWLGPTQRTRVATLAEVATGRLFGSDLLDDGFGAALTPVQRVEIDELLDPRAPQASATWSVDPFSGPPPDELARECAERHGVWPLSFSYPRVPVPLDPEPALLVSPITPGFPYAYEDEREYLETYRSAYLGITYRKAGWDCFRHVEIMAAGAVPWMIDARDIPRFSMTHYPKQALTKVAEFAAAHAGRPDDATRRAFRRYFDQHLTSEAMARYLLASAGLTDADSVLFVDERLPHHADYLSVMTLIGLKQILGERCQVMFPVDYIYDDTSIDVARLYGRGFGYTRVVSGELRSASERGSLVAPSEAAAVIVGSVTRNEALARAMLTQASAGRTIWIHGEDLPPAANEVREYRRAGVHMFVRAIHKNT